MVLELDVLVVVVVNPVTEQPRVVAVVSGEQVEVVRMELLELNAVGTHWIVTCNSV